MSERAGSRNPGLSAGGDEAVDGRRCRSLLQAIDDGVVVADADRQVTFANERAATILGCSRDDLVERSADECYRDPVDEHGTSLESVAAAFDRAYDRAEPVHDRIIGLRRPAGERVWLSVNAAPQRTECGDADGVVFVFEDVTDRRETAGDPEEILGRVSDAFYALDEEFRFTYVNGRAEELLQASEDELLGESLWEAYPEAAEIESVREVFRTAMETQEPQAYECYYEPLEIWVEATVYPSETGVSAYFRDISERKEREAEQREIRRELEESEERRRLALEAGEMGTWELDLQTDGSPVRSPQHDQIFGYEEPLDDWSFESFLEHVHPEDRDEVERRFERAFETGRWAFECRIIRADGEQRTIEAQGKFHYDDGDPVRAVGVVRDVTERKRHERYLEDAKAQLEAATEAGAVGTWEWHVPDDEFVTGASFARTFGVDPAAARRGVPLERILSSIHEADRDRVADAIQSALERCGEYEQEYRVRSADGDLRWVVARGHVECDADGEPVRFPGALTDITERKRAELELERQSRELETLFQVLPVGVVVANANGSLRRANETATEIWGGDAFDLESVEDYEQFSATWAESGEPVEPTDWTMYRVLQGESVTEPNIYEIDAFDGERRIIMEHGKPVRDADGNVSRAVVTLTDVTERRTYERALEEHRRQLSTLMDNVPGMVYRCRTEEGWPMEYVSDACRELTGYEPEAVESGRVSYGDEIMVDADREAVWEEIQEMGNDGETFSVTYRIETADGDRRWVRSYGRGDFEDGDLVALEGIVSDITDRKRLEEDLKASNERLEQFAYAASHDLQEPLRMVTSYLQLLESRYGDAFDEDGEEFLAFALDGAERMREMIDGLLEYSRVDTRGDSFESVALDDVVADVREDLQVRIDETDADVTVADLPQVRGDPSQLRQLFQNLLENAITYSGDEPPRLEVDAERVGDEWVISVADDGIGIDPGDAERVFEVFQRLHTREEYDGTGIGLALCRRIVERHSGEIWVDSEPGDGTTFRFTLPVV
ncbi:PAS domain-containing sensor histidine kinase [Natronolimnohabitans innermongolicus]|uniref:histidine kinase n=1 Tax=Natronolimnohabitans innermongolicus JCM 12255 TaxID=1227499 RepID=L9WV22_9EURY|nr:PAS domain S-box protein [Natronolimnohabitans innermongolicus]ELY53272.1 PAS/PAC sensor signal transduction histidine kinase [Natronolimnohabitans innermongolicus JCM 12255]